MTTEPELVEAIRAAVDGNQALADALRLQAIAIQALADAVAEPVDDEDAEPEWFLDGTPVEG